MCPTLGGHFRVKLLEQENAKSKKLNDLVLYKNKLSQQIEDIEIQFINVGISKIDLDNGDNPILKLREIHEKHILEVKSLNVAVAPYKEPVANPPTKLI